MLPCFALAIDITIVLKNII